MALCPDDQQPLFDENLGQGCRRCGGVWASAEELAQRIPNSASALAAETRADSAAFKIVRRCPDCDAALAPWRIGALDAWADRCASCERFWLERQALRSLTLASKRQAVVQAYQSFSAEERKEIARDLATESLGDGYPLSPLHAAMAYLGLPVVRRTRGSRTPVATWLLALALVAAFTFGGGEVAAASWGLHPATPDWTQALTANFVHFGLWHLLGNLYFLFAFGDGVEQRLPRPAIWVLFLVAGTASLAFDGWVQPEVEVIAGASGGIAALMGACVVLQPQAKVVMNLFGRAVEVPIWGWGLAELGFQSFMAMIGVPGTAWLAHLAGMVLGASTGALVRAAKLELKAESA